MTSGTYFDESTGIPHIHCLGLPVGDQLTHDQLIAATQAFIDYWRGRHPGGCNGPAYLEAKAAWLEQEKRKLLLTKKAIGNSITPSTTQTELHKMNVVAQLTARIEDYYTTNKKPCKSYATQEAAEKATAKMAQAAATYFDKQNRADAPSAHYVVFYVEKMGRWVGCINLSELINRHNSTGGYLGFCTGFFTW